MIVDTHKAFKGRLEGLKDIPSDTYPQGRPVKLTWGFPSEHNTDTSRKNVPDITQSIVEVHALSAPIDSLRTRKPQEIGKSILKDKLPTTRKQAYWEPHRILYQVSIRTEGPNAEARMWDLKKKINNALRNCDYLAVTTDVYGDGESSVIRVLIVNTGEVVVPPPKTGRREFVYHFTYSVDSGVFSSEETTDVAQATEITVQTTIQATEGNSTEDTVIIP